MPPYEDITQPCIDCKKDFTITIGEQEFYASKMDENGKPYNLPKRCKPCRAEKKRRFARYDGRPQAPQEEAQPEETQE